MWDLCNWYRIPDEIREFESCRVFSREKYEEIEKEKCKVVTLGGLKLDEDEEAVLSLNPKFSVLKKLETEECERDTRRE